jgi:hypothetical protein
VKQFTLKVSWTCSTFIVHFASPLEEGERIEVRGSRPTETILLQQTLTLPLSQTHTLALTGASASVSPKRRERGEATHYFSEIFKILSASSANGADGIGDIEGKVATGSGERVGRRASFKSVVVFHWDSLCLTNSVRFVNLK